MTLGIIKLTLTQLLNCGAHQGYVRQFFKGQIKPYLIGYKGIINIFNLSNAHLQFKTVLRVIVNIVAKRQKILVVNHYHEELNLYKLQHELKRCIFLEGHWRGGFLTNFKFIRLYTDYSRTVHPHLWALSTPPALAIFLNTTVENWSINESINCDLPTCVFTGSTFANLTSVLYPIVANNYTAEPLTVYLGLIQTAVKRGLIKEQLNITQII